MKFFRYLDQVIFGTKNACFSSSYDIEDAATNLSVVVLQPSPKFKFSYFISRYILRQSISTPDLTGKVSKENVFVFRHRQGMGRTQFRPIFKGKFVVEDNQTFLRGSFSMALSTKVITILWIGFSIYLQVMFIKASQQEIQPVIFLIPGIIILIFLLFYGFGRWVSREDRHFISEKIEASINNNADT